MYIHRIDKNDINEFVYLSPLVFIEILWTTTPPA